MIMLSISASVYQLYEVYQEKIITVVTKCINIRPICVLTINHSGILEACLPNKGKYESA